MYINVAAQSTKNSKRECKTFLSWWTVWVIANGKEFGRRRIWIEENYPIPKNPEPIAQFFSPNLSRASRQTCLPDLNFSVTGSSRSYFIFVLHFGHTEIETKQTNLSLAHVRFLLKNWANPTIAAFTTTPWRRKCFFFKEKKIFESTLGYLCICCIAIFYSAGVVTTVGYSSTGPSYCFCFNK
jgi:hypothetical protein